MRMRDVIPQLKLEKVKEQDSKLEQKRDESDDMYSALHDQEE